MARVERLLELAARDPGVGSPRRRLVVALRQIGAVRGPHEEEGARVGLRRADLRRQVEDPERADCARAAIALLEVPRPLRRRVGRAHVDRFGGERTPGLVVAQIAVVVELRACRRAWRSRSGRRGRAGSRDGSRRSRAACPRRRRCRDSARVPAAAASRASSDRRATSPGLPAAAARRRRRPPPPPCRARAGGRCPGGGRPAPAPPAASSSAAHGESARAAANRLCESFASEPIVSRALLSTRVVLELGRYRTRDIDSPGGRSLRRSIGLPLTIGIVLVLLALTLAVGWNVLVVRGIGDVRQVAERLSGTHWVLLSLGTLFYALLIAGLALLCAWLVREMRHSQRQQAFLDAVTHEMKTPLASLRLYLDTLRPPRSRRRTARRSSSGACARTWRASSAPSTRCSRPHARPAPAARAASRSRCANSSRLAPARCASSTTCRPRRCNSRSKAIRTRWASPRSWRWCSATCSTTR